MIAIVAADQRWGIGNNNKIPWKLHGDMKFFRETTIGHTVVLGRKTLKSFPNGKPLPNRRHCVLTTGEWHDSDVEIYHSIDGLLDALKPVDDVYVIGGASVYAQLLPYCDTVLVTRILRRFDTDTSFPNLDHDAAWNIVDESDIHQENGIKYLFAEYKRTE